MKKIYLFALLSAVSTPSLALESFTGKVTMLEPSYLPGALYFQMDTGNSTCPTGTWLKWQNANTENNMGVYSTLMTALVSGKKVNFHFDNGDTNCAGKHLHLIQ